MSFILSCYAANFITTSVFIVLFAISEWVGSHPKIKQNSVYQIVRDIIRKLAENA